MRRMSLVIVAAALSFGAVENVSAQDILRSLYSSRPVANWTGLYVGGNFGYGWGTTDTVENGLGAVPTSQVKPKGILGGLQVGGIAQSGIWVFGFEADIQGTTQKAEVLTTSGGSALTDSNKMPWFGTARARAGIASDALLFYATGGLAFGEYKRHMQLVSPSFTVLDFSTFKPGWTVGGGVEGMITRNFAWRIEYLHLHFGEFSDNFIVTAGGVPVGTVTAGTRVTNNILRFGLNYFFR
jgi:outer membrane immunogenic protein